MFRRILMLVPALWLIAAGVALADDAALGRQGETVYPISEPAVRMAAEQVDLIIRRQTTLVDVTFTFANEGPARSVLMGFPVGNPEFVESRGDPELHDFKTWIDGKPVSVQREPGVRPQTPVVGENGNPLTYPEWLTWTVDFGANETRTVRNTYWATNYRNSSDEVASGYILRTGQVWKGPIGSAVITAAFDGVLPGQIFGAHPTSFRWEGDRMVWRLNDFEPDRDITVRFRLRPEAWPEGDLFNSLMAAEYHSGPDSLLMLRAAYKKPCCDGAPGPMDWAIAKFEYLYGSRPEAVRIARAGLKWGDNNATMAYIAVREGLSEPQELLLLRDLTPGIRRYLMDRAGLRGSPPTAPTLLPNGTVLVTDPDGDLDDFGLKLWLSPNESLEPVGALSGFEFHLGDQTEYRRELPNRWDEQTETVWYRGWAVDGRGQRVDTGLVRLTLREPPPPQAVAPVPNPAGLLPVSAQVQPASPPGRSPLYAWAMVTAIGVGVLAGYLLFRSE